MATTTILGKEINALSATSATSASYASTAQTLLGSVSTASYVVNTVTGTNSADLVYGNMADNDQFRIRVGGTATNAGFVEIATADDGTEPIYVRQYTGVFTSLARTATLLDGSGNSSFPGGVTATSFTGSLSGNATSATTATSASTHTVTTNALHYPVFVDTNNASPTSEKLGTVGNLTYNPSIGSLNATSITGSLQGTASYATMASQSGYTIQMVLATTGSNLAASTTYRMGAPVRDQLLTTGGSNRIYVPRPGKVRYVNVFVRTSGTLASAGTSTFQLNKSNVVGEIIGTSTSVGSVASVSVESTAVSMSVSLGDYLDIGFTTPAWATLPTAVECNAIIYIENNI